MLGQWLRHRSSRCASLLGKGGSNVRSVLLLLLCAVVQWCRFGANETNTASKKQSRSKRRTGLTTRPIWMCRFVRVSVHPPPNFAHFQSNDDRKLSRCVQKCVYGILFELARLPCRFAQHSVRPSIRPDAVWMAQRTLSPRYHYTEHNIPC